MPTDARTKALPFAELRGTIAEIRIEDLRYEPEVEAPYQSVLRIGADTAILHSAEAPLLAPGDEASVFGAWRDELFDAYGYRNHATGVQGGADRAVERWWPVWLFAAILGVGWAGVAAAPSDPDALGVAIFLVVYTALWGVGLWAHRWKAREHAVRNAVHAHLRAA